MGRWFTMTSHSSYEFEDAHQKGCRKASSCTPRRCDGVAKEPRTVCDADGSGLLSSCSRLPQGGLGPALLGGATGRHRGRLKPVQKLLTGMMLIVCPTPLDALHGGFT